MRTDGLFGNPAMAATNARTESRPTKRWDGGLHGRKFLPCDPSFLDETWRSSRCGKTASLAARTELLFAKPIKSLFDTAADAERLVFHFFLGTRLPRRRSSAPGVGLCLDVNRFLFKVSPKPQFGC
jgi:hypothetical protein